MSVVAPSRPEILSLFRSLLRVARNFPDYNIREYMKRRTLDAFRDNRTLSDPPSISSAFSDGKSQLDVAKRQAVVYSLYAPPLRSVMERCSEYDSYFMLRRGQIRRVIPLPLQSSDIEMAMKCKIFRGS